MTKQQLIAAIEEHIYALAARHYGIALEELSLANLTELLHMLRDLREQRTPWRLPGHRS